MLEDGKILFDLRSAKYSLSVEHERCTLQLWSAERNVVRTIVAVTERTGGLRLSAKRLGHAQPKSLDLVTALARRAPTTRSAARTHYQ
ncbi:MAG TPA: hypothetical protein VMF89_35590, partial [Polyangiales bacterium]|nr:hypothetical protein [Polyangiales bacterium]